MATASVLSSRTSATKAEAPALRADLDPGSEHRHGHHHDARVAERLDELANGGEPLGPRRVDRQHHGVERGGRGVGEQLVDRPADHGRGQAGVPSVAAMRREASWSAATTARAASVAASPACAGRRPSSGAAIVETNGAGRPVLSRNLRVLAGGGPAPSPGAGPRGRERSEGRLKKRLPLARPRPVPGLWRRVRDCRTTDDLARERPTRGGRHLIQ